MSQSFKRPLTHNPFAALDEATKAKLFILQFQLKRAEREKRTSKSRSTKQSTEGALCANQPREKLPHLSNFLRVLEGFDRSLTKRRR